MHIKLRRTLLQAATAIAIAAGAVAAFLPTAASAAEFTASTTVNVRERPTTSSRIIDRLHPGQTANIGGCRHGWCYLTDLHGFVSSSYLRDRGRPVSPDFNLSFNFPQGSFSSGTGGVSIGIGSPPPPPNRPGPGPGGGRDRDACFFADRGYDGRSFCLDRREERVTLPRGWNNRISSIENRRGLTVTVCRDPYFRGGCRTYTPSARSLGSFNNVISSIRVR
jgi:hypothetical protein